MKWYPLSVFQWIILLVFLAVVDAFTYTRKYFLPESLRPYSYIVFVVLVLAVFFFIVQPYEPFVLSGTLCVILGVIAIILVLVQDTILANTLSWKTAIVFSGAALGPLTAGYCYRPIRSSGKGVK